MFPIIFSSLFCIFILLFIPILTLTLSELIYYRYSLTAQMNPKPQLDPYPVPPPVYTSEVSDACLLQVWRWWWSPCLAPSPPCSPWSWAVCSSGTSPPREPSSLSSSPPKPWVDSRFNTNIVFSSFHVSPCCYCTHVETRVSVVPISFCRTARPWLVPNPLGRAATSQVSHIAPWNSLWNIPYATGIGSVGPISPVSFNTENIEQ